MPTRHRKLLASRSKLTGKRANVRNPANLLEELNVGQLEAKQQLASNATVQQRGNESSTEFPNGGSNLFPNAPKDLAGNRAVP
jgi:hypothetical protein